MHISYFDGVYQIQKGRRDPKEIPLIRTGFQAFIDNLFWFLLFSSQKQAYNMLANKELSDDYWNMKREEIAAEHMVERAADDLITGWKAWLVDSMDHSYRGNVSVAVPATGITSIIRD